MCLRYLNKAVSKRGEIQMGYGASMPEIQPSSVPGQLFLSCLERPSRDMPSTQTHSCYCSLRVPRLIQGLGEKHELGFLPV